MGVGLLNSSSPAFGQDSDGRQDLNRGDVAILRFLAAAELIEADLWGQYAELGGVTGGSMSAYQTAFTNLDGDGNAVHQKQHAG
jgi:hypothetical protein